MEHRPLGRSGLRVSVLSLGAMTFGASRGFMKGVTSTDREARALLDRALDAGIDTIDTANVYSEGRSEELLGRWLEGRRDRVVLATKCRFPTRPASPGESRPADAGLSRRAILRACEGSLKRLRTDRIDLYQVHMQDGAVPIEETLRALDDLVRTGKALYVGCSNYTGYRLVESLWAADGRNLEPFVSLQLQWSLLARDAERELVPAARAFGIGVLVWSPLARGFLSGKYVRGKAPPEGSRLSVWADNFRQVDHDRAWGVLERVREVARRLGTSPAAVSIAWLLRRPETSSVIVGARTLGQLEDNLAALEVRLTEQDAKGLEEASRPAWGYPYEFIGAREPW
ncbi:MAG TPA: aldo/keto reductase [Planctomycetota bacterium]|jgi:aryl-alcohol dehydrogenase-like predicted oxidoreductase|nr:aldo/keto reductase [Planctomycetota bacterium]